VHEQSQAITRKRTFSMALIRRFSAMRPTGVLTFH